MDASPVSMMPSGYHGSARLAARSQSSATDGVADRRMTAYMIGFGFGAACAMFVAER